MPTSLPDGLVSRAHRALEPLHAFLYFAPESDEHYTAVGLRPGRMGYFASRSAPMGAVSPGVTAATFYNFNPELVARFLPRAWTLATPETVIGARFAAVEAAQRRLFGAEVLASPELAEAAGLAREATTALRPEARPLYAGHADLDWPDAPHLVLWHAVTLLREYRGDGHVLALLANGLSGVEAIVTHTATGRGFTREAGQALRGWSDEQWDGAADSLAARGLMDADGLTAAGVALRERVEAETDRLDEAAWRHLGVERTERLVELGRQLSRVIVANGAFPAGVFASPRA